MKLYLVRHGHASQAHGPEGCPLTARGREEVEAVARSAAGRVSGLGVIWHSTKLRARETAEILAEYLKPPGGLVEREGLAPNDPVGPVAAEVASSGRDIMIVSHIPFLPKLADVLLAGTADAGPIQLVTVGFACLDADDALHWRLAWTLDPNRLT